jgi:hypothetical protein
LGGVLAPAACGCAPFPASAAGSGDPQLELNAPLNGLRQTDLRRKGARGGSQGFCVGARGSGRGEIRHRIVARVAPPSGGRHWQVRHVLAHERAHACTARSHHLDRATPYPSTPLILVELSTPGRPSGSARAIVTGYFGAATVRSLTTCSAPATDAAFAPICTFSFGFRTTPVNVTVPLTATILTLCA